MTEANQAPRQTNSNEQMMTVKQVAEFLQLCERQVRRLISDGQLPHHRINRNIRISPRALKVFLAERGP